MQTIGAWNVIVQLCTKDSFSPSNSCFFRVHTSGYWSTSVAPRQLIGYRINTWVFVYVFFFHQCSLTWRLLIWSHRYCLHALVVHVMHIWHLLCFFSPNIWWSLRFFSHLLELSDSWDLIVEACYVKLASSLPCTYLFLKESCNCHMMFGNVFSFSCIGSRIPC